MSKETTLIRINETWCKGCGICIAFCPTNVLEAGEDGIVFAARPEACTRCGLCELRCPDYAISVGGETIANKD
ncbi:MAG TPA: 4Fe-4S binding protein [bacterium]|jgi:2-oxoglutarate ferredoxin oxidoreductase subunit delta|nr:4Fe-4S binding protein [bacterium]